jgi:hypothetical protein
VILWIFIAGVALAAGFLLYKLVAGYRRETERRRAAQQKARLTKQAAASRISALPERMQLLGIKVEAMASRISADDARPLTESLTRIEQLTGITAQTYSDLRHSAGDPDRPRLSEAEYLAIEGAYQKVLAALHEADTIINGLEQQIDSLIQMASQVPARITEVSSTIEETRHHLAAPRKDGLSTTYPEEFLRKARALLDQADAFYQKKQFAQAMQHAAEAKEVVSQAVRAAEELPRQKQEAEAGITALEARIEQVKMVIIAGRETFNRISATYAESSWQSIYGNGTEATNRIN